MKKTFKLLGIISLVVGSFLIVYYHFFINYNLISLNSVLNQNNLGTIITENQKLPTEQEVKNALKSDSKNQSLNLDDIKITNIGSKSALINSINYEQMYQGFIKVFYQIETIDNLQKLVVQPNLGEIDIGSQDLPTGDQIKTATTDKNPDLKIDSFQITSISKKSALIIGNNSYTNDMINIFTAPVKIYYSVKTIKNLGAVITSTNLETILIENKELPNPEEIKNNLKKGDINPELDISSISVSNISFNTATITSDSEKYFGSVIITFHIKSIDALDKLIINRNLGEIYTINNNLPDEQQVINAVEFSNKNSLLDFSLIHIANISKNSATIVGSESREKSYTNFVNVFFKINSSQNLANLIENKNLGEIFIGTANIPTSNQIAEALIAKNHNIDLNSITITNITNNSAIINSNNENLKGQIEISFKICNIKDIKLLIKNTELGDLNIKNKNLPSVDQIKSAIVNKNPNINNEDIYVNQASEYEATITGVSNSITNYTNSVIVTYNVVRSFSLNEIIKNKNLGYFNTGVSNFPSSLQIKEKLLYCNSNVNLNNIEILTIEKNYTIIKGINNYYNETKIFYTSEKVTNIKNYLTNTNLGDIYVGNYKIPFVSQITSALKRDGINSRLDTSDITISYINANSAFVTGKKLYWGVIKINYNTKQFTEMTSNTLLKSPGQILTDRNGVIYIAKQDGIYKSIDKSHFEKMKDTNNNFSLLGFDCNNNLYLKEKVLWNSNCVYKYNNEIGNLKLCFNVIDNIEGFAASKLGTCYIGVSTYIFELNANGEVIAKHFLNGVNIYSLACDQNGNVFVGTNNGLYKSQNSGFYQRISNTSSSISKLVIDKYNTIFIGLLNDNFVYKSNDGKYFSKINVNLGTLNTITTGFNNTIYVGSSLGVYKMQSESWEKIKEIDSEVISICVDNTGNTYIATAEGIIYKSEKF